MTSVQKNVIYPGRQTPVTGSGGNVTVAFDQWFRSLTAYQPPTGSGFVIDGSLATFGQTTMYQGLDANRGPASPGSIYYAIDTGNIYTVTGGAWSIQNAAQTGAVTKPAHSNVTTIAPVNFAPGTYGGPTQTLTLTVLPSGQITAITSNPITPTAAVAAGTNGSVQFNLGGFLAADASINFIPSQARLYLTNMSVAGSIGFVNPQVTLNNLFATSAVGDIKTFNGTNVVSLPVGTDGQVLTADSTSADGLKWTTTGVIEVPFQWGVVNPFFIGIIPAGKELLEARVIVNTLFDGTGASISLGSVANELLTTTQIDPYNEGSYAYEAGFKYSVDTTVNLYVVPGSASQGEGLVVLRFQTS